MSKKSKQTTTSNQQTHMTTTPSNPGWVDSGLGDMGGMLSRLGQMDPHSLVAGPDPLQLQAGKAAGGLTTSPLYDEAAGMFRGFGGAGANTYDPSMVGEVPQMRGESVLDGLDKYMSPYNKDVVDTSLADYDFGAGQQQGQANLDQAQDATFGGSGGAIEQALLKDRLTSGRGALSANLRDSAFRFGAGLSADDANRRQQAGLTNTQLGAQRAFSNQEALNRGREFNAGQRDGALSRQMTAAGGLATIGQQQGADDRANIGAQASIGDILRQISQQQAGAPVNLAAVLSGLWGGLPLGLLHGQTSDGTSSGTSTGKTSESGMGGEDIAKMAAAAAMAFSDAALKQDVETVGFDARGRRWVEFAYTWEPKVRHRGVIAQEVALTDPDAVHKHASGFLMVDYAKLMGSA